MNRLLCTLYPVHVSTNFLAKLPLAHVQRCEAKDTLGGDSICSKYHLSVYYGFQETLPFLMQLSGLIASCITKIYEIIKITLR